MITLKRSGFYRMVETKRDIKILDLDDESYAWVIAENIGEMLVVTHKPHKTDCILGMGHYHIYDVDDEARLSDQQHLELEAGRNVWQGYLLLTGLPNESKKRGRIIPTHEIITGNPRFKRLRVMPASSKSKPKVTKERKSI